VPFVDLKAQYQALRADLLQAVANALDSMQLFLGPNVRALEEEFAAYCGTKYAVAVGSGTSALHLALRAVGVEPGDEVITVANTFVATAGAIIQAGARPVFIDIDPGTHLLDLDQVDQAISQRTRAIIPVHLFGRMVDMKSLMALAKARNLSVIEDACQAHGARRGGKLAGAWGQAGCFSFYLSKNLGAYGEMGMVTSDDAEVRDAVRRLRDHGSSSKYQHQVFGFNERPDEIQAAMVRVKLRHLDEWNDARELAAGRYREALQSLPSVRLLDDAADGQHVHHLFVVELESQRDAVRSYLSEKGIETGIHYPVPIHLQPAWRTFGGSDVALPRTERAASRILSLPIYPELSLGQLSLVVEALDAATRSTAAPAQR